MKKITQLIMICLAPVAFGQTNHQVNAQAMAWSPNDITIDMGDSVTWVNNNNGSHNINGTTATYPANPESFSMLTSGTNWTYGKRFNVPGVYTYRCDVHSGTMIGKVTVIDPSLGVTENSALSTVHFGPNPADDLITIYHSAPDFTVNVYDMLGKRVLSERMAAQNQLNVAFLNPGMYLVEVISGGTRIQERLMKN